jgi:hypothetical protein
MTRCLLAACATVAAFFATAAVANAATYLVDETGADVSDCTAAPCATIQYAIDQHRGDPQLDDLISVAAGDYAQNVDATDPADDGLTIRGELDPDGIPATTISGDGGPGAPNCFAPGCIVAIGLDSDAPDPAVTVQLDNVAVTQANAIVDQTPIHVEGGSDLDTVDSIVDHPDTFAAVEFCNDPGTDIVNSYLDATGTDARGVDGCAEVDIVDTEIFTDDAPALNVAGTPGETTEVTRSWLSSDFFGAGTTAIVDDDLIVDSSIVSGGVTALELPGTGDALINNSTIDAQIPWDSNGTSVFVGRSDDVTTTIDSSILVDEVFVETNGGDGTLTCEYTNFTQISLPNPLYTNDCPSAGDPGSTNTANDPADLFDPGGSSSPWELASGSAAIDAGQPGAVPAGLSNTDFDLDPRRVPGRAATCPDGVRDQGAYEARAVSCAPPTQTLTVSTAGTGSGTVTGPGINCGAGNTDCSETFAPGATLELNATAADGSEFQGFSGGGCSASPCTVTLDSNKSVAASFRDTRSDTLALTVEVSGAGGGVVTGPGINCGSGETENDCSQNYAVGEQVELSADPNKNSIFGRFTGSGCVASPCTVTMDAPRSVVGRFDDARIPRTTFAAKPERPTRRPVFRMRSSQPRPTFECRVDGGDWEGCEKRVELRGLDAGRHTFRARSTNKFGVTGPPVKARFRVKG